MDRRTPLITRFAPSPTGFLHVGHVASALYVWSVARALGARVFLRIEDHDRIRSRPEFEAAIIEDLDWLGFKANNDCRWEGRSPFRQSDNDAVYQQCADDLIARGLVYACDCSRRQLQGDANASGRAAVESEDALPDGIPEIRYSGRCRDRGLALDTPNSGLRLRLPGDVVSFEDGGVGPTVQCPAQQCGDLLIKDRHGNWTYQFAVVVDDLRHGVNLVVRGQDLLESTGRQILLGRILGSSRPPAYFHHPLLLGDDRKKLSKRTLAAAISARRKTGESPLALLGEVGCRLGLADAQRSEPFEYWAERISQRHDLSCPQLWLVPAIQRDGRAS